MIGLARKFMVLAVLSALAGMVWGIQMAISHDHALSPAHAHLNLLGWVMLALFAVYYHVVPDAAESRLARVHFAVALLSVVTIVPGIVLALTGVSEAVAALGAFLTLGSMALFAAAVLRGAGAEGTAGRLSRAPH